MAQSTDERRFWEAFNKKITDVVFDTHREIILNTPVDTGRLRSSIQIEQIPEGWVIGTNVHYAEFVELGHMTSKGNIVEGRRMFLKGVQYLERRLKTFFK